MMMYEGFAVSEKGYQHILNHTVCQDSTQYLQDADCVVATVADGHGSKQYFRSDRGSRFAAEIACNKIREFLKSITFPFPDSKTKKSVVTQLIHSIITEWHIAVRNDLIKSPFTPNELERVPEKYQKTFQFFTGENYRAHTESEISDLIQKEHSHVQKAYGTTLIAVGLCKSYAIGLHIGDGKCVALYEDGTMDEPIPWDENCHLNRCTSICDKNAASEFRCHIWDNQIPVAFFLGTDGIDDTFAEMLHSFYRNVALDFLHDNFRKRTEMLQANLANISKSGSHDDVSIAGILDVQKLSAIEQTLQQITKLETLTAQKKHLQDTIQELQFQLERCSAFCHNRLKRRKPRKKSSGIWKRNVKSRKSSPNSNRSWQVSHGILQQCKEAGKKKTMLPVRCKLLIQRRKHKTTLQSVPRFQRMTGHRKSQRSKMHRKLAFPPVKQKPHPHSQRNSLWMQQNRIRQKATMPAK